MKAVTEPDDLLEGFENKYLLQAHFSGVEECEDQEVAFENECLPPGS